jgi:holo-[acyl-carrier protein] synthase
MILGTGIDIADIRRIQKIYDAHEVRFVQHVLAPAERAIMPEKRTVEFIAGRFAAKEAIIKALGAVKVSLTDIIIEHHPNGKPFVSNEAQLLSKAGFEHARLHISISHDGNYAIAMAILEAMP